MKLAVIVAEYNPFHNGHAWQIAQTRAAGATHVAVVMGGNFLQRGEAALFEKRLRAHGALLGGADLVVELPLPYALATAQQFAAGGVAIAAALGIPAHLSFGCEAGELSPLAILAQTVDSPAFSAALPAHLAKGVTFAKARQLAVAELLGEEVAALLKAPNNILAVEYLREIARQNVPLTPLPIPRQGPAHDAAQGEGVFASASYIRALWRETPALAQGYLPPAVYELLQRAQAMDSTTLEVAQLSYLRRLDAQSLAGLPHMGEGLENRLYHAIREGRSLEEILALAKTKRYPLSRLRRLLLQAFLQLPSTFSDEAPPYIHVLGYNTRGTEVLAQARTAATVPLSDSLATLARTGERAALWGRLEATATDLYTAALPSPYSCGYEYTVTPIRLL